MADEKMQELSLEDMESVGGGVKIDRGDEKRKSVAVAEAAEAETAEVNAAALHVAKQIW